MPLNITNKGLEKYIEREVSFWVEDVFREGVLTKKDNSVYPYQIEVGIKQTHSLKPGDFIGVPQLRGVPRRRMRITYQYVGE